MILADFTGVGVLALILLLLALERFSRFRRPVTGIEHRWITNFGLMLLGGVVVSIVFPVAVFDIAADIPDGRVQGLALPLVVEVLLATLLLDLFAYWEHRVLHEVRFLWRWHLVHHSDTEVDVTTGERHHPVEKLISLCLGLLLLFAFGFSAQALLVYLLIAQFTAIIGHANLLIPEGVDRTLRSIFVTPAVHRIHHSTLQRETNSNYGNIFTLWDRLFGTYTSPGRAIVPTLGLEYFRQPQDTQFVSVLMQPLWLGRPEPVVTTTDPIAPARLPALSRQWRQTLCFAAVGCALATLALWPFVVELAALWSEIPAYQYAWLVIPFFIYIAGWHHGERFFEASPRPTYAGLVPTAIALCLLLVSIDADFKIGQNIALALVLQGILLCSLGLAAYRRWLPLMLLLFWIVPCGDVMQPLLRDLTLKWVEWFALLSGLPYTVDGYHIAIDGHKYVVLSECAGLQFFTLGAFLGYAFGLLLFNSLGRVLALAALGALSGILTNAARVWIIVALDQMSGAQMDLAGHTNIQWIAWFASLGALLYAASRLAQDSGSTPKAKHGALAQNPSLAKYSPVVAGLLLLVAVATFQVRQPLEVTEASAIPPAFALP